MKVNVGPYVDKRTEDIEINDYDLWNLDQTLAFVILNSLKRFKENNHYSMPSNLFGDEYNNILYDPKFYNELPKGPLHTKLIVLDKKANLKWNKIMDDMIWAFEQIYKDMPHSSADEKRIQKGLNYFAKYYRSLWY